MCITTAGTVAVAALFGACATPRQDTRQARQAQMYGLVQKFDRFDYNGDGYLTRAEIVAGVREAGTIELTEAEFTKLMKAYDTNHDGRISQREAQRGAERGPGIFDGM